MEGEVWILDVFFQVTFEGCYGWEIVGLIQEAKLEVPTQLWPFTSYKYL